MTPLGVRTSADQSLGIQLMGILADISCSKALLEAPCASKILGLWNSAAGFISMSMQIPISLDFALSLNRGGPNWIEIGGIQKRDLAGSI